MPRRFQVAHGSNWTFGRHFIKSQKSREYIVRVLIGWQTPTHVCQSFTRQIRVYQHEKVGEKVGENRGKFYLSPTVCQHVCRLFLCRSHTPTWVCQHEFANFSLPCEGRFSEFLFLICVQKASSMKILLFWVINSSRHRKCFVQGFIHSLFVSKALTRSYLACVASVSVGFGSKERPRNGVFGILPARKMGREPRKERWG